MLSRNSCVGFLVVLLAAAQPASAADYVWNKFGGTFTWDTDGNWTTAGSPAAAGDTASFVAYPLGATLNTLGTTVNLAAPTTVGSIAIGPTPFAYTFGNGGTAGNVFNLDNGASPAAVSVDAANGQGVSFTATVNLAGTGGGTITNNLPASSTAAFGLSFAAFNTGTGSGAATFAGQGRTTITSANLSGSRDLVYSGGGLLSLAGANTGFTGKVSVTGSGRVGINQLTAIGNDPGAATADAISLANGGTLQLTTASSAFGVNRGVTIGTGGGAFEVAGTAVTLTVAGTVVNAPSTTGGLTKNGNGTLALQGANTYAGPTTVNLGTLTLSGTAGSIASDATVNNGATLSVLNSTNFVADRIGNTKNVTLNGGFLAVTGSSTAGNNTNEVFNNLTVGGLGVVTVAPGTGTTNKVAPTALVRTASDTLYVRGTNLGQAVATNGNANLVFGTSLAADLVGSGVGILPYAIGNAGNTTAASSLSVGYVTYDATNGVRPLAAADYTGGTITALTASTLATNFRQTGSVTLVAGTTYNTNSYINDTFGITAPTGGTATIKINSGAITFTDNFGVTLGSATATNVLVFDFSNRTGYINLANSSGAATTTVSNFGRLTGFGGNGLVINGFFGTAIALVNPNNNSDFTNVTVNGANLTGSTTGLPPQLVYGTDANLGTAGGTVTLNNGLLIYGVAADLASNRQITITGGQGGIGVTGSATTVYTQAGKVTGSGTLNKVSTGILVLTNNANDYTGGTILSGGTLRLNGATVAGTGPINLGNPTAAGTGGTLQFGAAVTVANTLTHSLSSTIDTNGNNATLSGGINAAFNPTTGSYTSGATLTKSGTGTLTLTGTGSVASTIAVTAGGLTLSGNGALPAAAGLTIASGATVTLDNSGTNLSNRFSGTVALSGGTFSFIGNAAGTIEALGTLSNTTGSSVVQVAASGSTDPTDLIFNTLGTITGTITFRGQNLGATTGAYTRIQFATAPTLTGGLISNAQFDDLAGNTGPATYDAVRGIILYVPPPASGTVLDNYSPSSVPTNAVFTTTGDAVANTGVQVFKLVLDAGAGIALNDGANGPDATNNNTATGTLRLNQLVSQNGAKAITAGTGAASKVVTFSTASGQVTTTSDLTIGAGVTLAGSGGLTKDGAGTLTLNGPYTVTGGALTATNGAVVLGATGSVASGTSVTLSNGGTTFTNSATGQTYGTVTVGTGTTFTAAESLTFAALTGAGTVSAAAGKTLTTTAAQTIATVIAGDGGLAFNPAAVGTLTLSGANLFTGGVTGNANARYILTNPAGFGTGAVNVSAQTASSTFSIPTVGFNFGTNGTGTVANNFVLTTTPAIDQFFLASTSTGQTVTLSGVISGGSATSRLVWDETGSSNSNVLILTNANNSFVSPVRVDFGTVAITSNGALGNAANGVFLQSSAPLGSLRFDANNITVASTRTVSIAAATSINTNGNNATIAGPLAGTSAFTKIGTGTLTFSNAANSHTGTITVSAGKMSVTGTFPTNASVVTVASGASLGGSGSLLRPITLSDGGTIEPGNGTATDVFNTGAVAFGNGTLRSFVDATGGVKLVSTGTFNRSAANSLLTIKLTGSESNFPNDSTSYTVRLLEFTSTTGVLGTNFAIDPNPVGFSFVGTPSLNLQATFLEITFTPTPEPGTIFGLVAGVLAAGGFVRRRVRKVA